MLVLTAGKSESFEKYSVRVCQSKLAPAAPDNFIRNKCLFYQNIIFNTNLILYTLIMIGVVVSKPLQTKLTNIFVN